MATSATACRTGFQCGMRPGRRAKMGAVATNSRIVAALWAAISRSLTTPQARASRSGWAAAWPGVTIAWTMASCCSSTPRYRRQWKVAASRQRWCAPRSNTRQPPACACGHAVRTFPPISPVTRSIADCSAESLPPGQLAKIRHLPLRRLSAGPQPAQLRPTDPRRHRLRLRPKAVARGARLRLRPCVLPAFGTRLFIEIHHQVPRVAVPQHL